MDYFDYQTGLSIGASVLAITLVVLGVAAEGKGRLSSWPDRLHASGWRWPLTVILGISLAFSLWQVADALTAVWITARPH